MASCKECSSEDLCGYVFDKNAETNCDGFDYAVVDEENGNGCDVKNNLAPSAECLKEKETEETTLKIKAAGYDAIKGIVGESFENVWESEETVTMIDGVIRMEEAVMKVLI